MLRTIEKIKKNDNPDPILITFLSKKSSDSFKKDEIVNPNPQRYTKNKNIVVKLISLILLNLGQDEHI
tara:strand:- start:9 stop:212 length:204 start_codon:yes stop_codon:yes gene_type:complete